MTLDITKYRNVIKGTLWKLNSYLTADDINDIIQDVYIKILLKKDEIREETGILGYFATVTRSVYLDRWRKSETRKEISRAEDVSLFHDHIPYIERDTEDDERLDLVMHYYNKLPIVLRETMDLRLQGLKYEEISAMTETPLGTVKARINRVKITLQNQLNIKPSL